MATTGYKRLRLSDFTLDGATDEITSDVKLPDSRIQSKGDAGTESSSGDLSTEWFIDEVDDLLKAVMLDDDGDFPAKLGKVQTYFTFIKAYYQGNAPVYQVFTGVQVGQVKATFEIGAKVTLQFSLNGMDNPPILQSGDDVYATVKGYCDDATDYVDEDGKLTKSYNTLKGSISVKKDGEIADQYGALIRSFNFTINQNPDSTGALFQVKAIDNSLGDEQIDGTIEVWNPQDNKAVALRNKAKDWTDDVEIEIVLKKNLISKTGDTEYTLKMNTSLKTPTESKDGNKLAFSIPFQVYDANGMTVEKTVIL